MGEEFVWSGRGDFFQKKVHTLKEVKFAQKYFSCTTARIVPHKIKETIEIWAYNNKILQKNNQKWAEN